jgi:hypothetical protein
MNTTTAKPQIGSKPAAKANGSGHDAAGNRPVDITEMFNSYITCMEETIRKYGMAPTGFHAIEACGLYVLSFDPGEIYEDFLTNVRLLCKARDLDAGLLFVPGFDGKRMPAGELSDREKGRYLVQVAVVAEDRQGRRLERTLPILRDAAGNFTGFGEDSTENPDPSKKELPRFMPEQRPTASERMKIRATLLSRGVGISHEALDAANRKAADKTAKTFNQKA